MPPARRQARRRRPASAGDRAGGIERVGQWILADAGCRRGSHRGRRPTGRGRHRGAAIGGGDPEARMTPAVRRLLREHGLSRSRSLGPVAVAASRATTSSPWSKPCGPASRCRAGGPVCGTRTARCARTAHGPRSACRGVSGARYRLRRAAGDADRGHGHVPGGSGRGPRAADPDAQGHRGSDDPRPAGTARLRPDGGRCHPARGRPGEGEEGLPSEGGHVAKRACPSSSRPRPRR